MDDDTAFAVVGALLAVLALGVVAGAVSGPLVSADEQREIGDATGEATQNEPDPIGTGGCLIGCGSGIRAQIGSVPTPVLAAVGLLVVGAAAFLLRGDREPTDPVDEAPPEPTESVAGDHAAAGIDPPEEPAATNDIYRAWRDLADRVDADRAATPGECAERASDRYDPDRVETVTDLFRRVRYGRADVTEDRERQARRALEDVEEGEE